MEEGFKEIIAAALITIASMAPAKAQQTANSIISSVPPSKVSAMTQDIKSADNTADLSSIIKSYTSGTEDIKTDVNIPKPSGYKPLSVQQREDWNKYLDYLGKEAGSPKLDKGSPETEGMKKLKDYLAANPNSSLAQFEKPEDLVKSIQYEMKQIRGGKDFPQLTPFELKTIQTLLLKTREPFMLVHKSDSDGNPGQYTTKEYYPLFGTSADYSKVMNTIYKTLVKAHNITTIDGVDITKLAK